jgi:hypothetical protein
MPGRVACAGRTGQAARRVNPGGLPQGSPSFRPARRNLSFPGRLPHLATPQSASIFLVRTPLTDQHICSIAEVHEHGGQVRCRRSRVPCPAWSAVIPTRCSWIPEPPPQKPKRLPSPQHKTPRSRKGEGLGVRAVPGTQGSSRYDPTAIQTGQRAVTCGAVVQHHSCLNVCLPRPGTEHGAVLKS